MSWTPVIARAGQGEGGGLAELRASVPRKRHPNLNDVSLRTPWYWERREGAKGHDAKRVTVVVGQEQP